MALRQEGALSSMIPLELGGFNEGILPTARRCHALGQSCGSAAMVFAMHQIQIACLVHHGGTSDWHRQFMRQIASEQLLLGSVTSEVGVGGQIRKSLCAIEEDAGCVKLHKRSTAISYGEQADALLITARRDDAANQADQVLLVGQSHQYRLDRCGTWDAMGMRGTCSHPFDVTLECVAEQILSAPFADIAEQTMQPVSHLLWSALWTGIAADAVFRARDFLRARARGGDVPSAARARLAEAAGLAQMAEGRLTTVLREFDEIWTHGPVPLSIEKAGNINALKVSVSAIALQVVNHAMMICGIDGYKNNTPHSVGRHLRDLHSAPLMISNERILESNGHMLLMQKPHLGAF